MIPSAIPFSLSVRENVNNMGEMVTKVLINAITLLFSLCANTQRVGSGTF